MSVKPIVDRCERLYEELDLATVAAWKDARPGRKAVGYLPTYVPRELLWAAGVLPVGILGANDQLEIVKGDACFQSYICHLPRSVLELGLSGRLASLDGMVFPSTCDVIRNLSGIWQLHFPDKLAFYLDVPQNFDAAVGGVFYGGVLRQLFDEMKGLSGSTAGDDELRAAIRLYNASRRVCSELYELRAAEPWRVPADECYLLMRAGMMLPPEEHTALVREYLDEVVREDRPVRDNARIAVVGAFCEQPPLDLIRVLERSGCYLVEDDFMLVSRWLGDQVDESGDPFEALTRAYLEYDGETAARYVPDGGCKGTRMREMVKRVGAEGVVFAAPSFCDPALLDRPMMMAALDEGGVAYTAFKYAENTGQLQPIREQAGTFADTIKLWGTE